MKKKLQEVAEICKAMIDKENHPPQFSADEAFKRILAILKEDFQDNVVDGLVMSHLARVGKLSEYLALPKTMFG